jgi:hypothetical protein
MCVCVCVCMYMHCALKTHEVTDIKQCAHLVWAECGIELSILCFVFLLQESAVGACGQQIEWTQ